MVSLINSENMEKFGGVIVYHSMLTFCPEPFRVMSNPNLSIYICITVDTDSSSIKLLQSEISAVLHSSYLHTSDYVHWDYHSNICN